MLKKLDYSFYKNNAVYVAQALLGKKLVYNQYEGIITETEAYRGGDDEASHAYSKLSKRNIIMFGPPGYSYVYMIYGMHHCLNIVTEDEGQPAAVLIRGIKIYNTLNTHLNGPGKICKFLGINKKDHGINLTDSKEFYVTNGIIATNIKVTNRIGITKAKDKLWRFLMEID